MDILYNTPFYWEYESLGFKNAAYYPALLKLEPKK